MKRFFSSKAPHFLSRLPSTLRRLPTTRLSTPNISSFSRGTFSFAGQTMSPAAEGPDPFNYTSGRWLRQDALEQQSRYIRFDFDALRRKVIALCPGAHSITSYTKTEGSFNRVFVFHTDNAKRVVARLPFPAAGPQRLVTNSEVATIHYLQQKTSIPIPKILEWSDDPSIIGSEYIIMEHAQGVPLYKKWESMSLNERLRCIEAMVHELKELANLDFPAYGSLYFADTPYISHTIPFDQEFSIGPHCGAAYWNCNAAQPKYFHDVKPNQGPWADLSAYCDSLADNGIASLPPTDPPQKPRYHGSVQTHRQLIEQGRAVLKALIMDSRIQNAAMPVMFHPDLHQRNIFVLEDDPSVISAFLDWQSISIEPSFCYAHERPDFAEPIPDSSYKDGLEPKSWACTRAFHAGMVLLAPKLTPALTMDETFFRPFRYISRTWKDSAVALREDLIELSCRWQELGLTQPCPFTPPCSDEVTRYQKDLELFNEVYNFVRMIANELNCATNGFVLSEQWEEVKSAHQWLFDGMLQEMLQANERPDNQSNINSEDDLREIWPFDPPERNFAEQ